MRNFVAAPPPHNPNWFGPPKPPDLAAAIQAKIKSLGG